MSMTLSSRIREAMEGAGLRPTDLASATGKTTGAVTHWLNGATKSLKAETAEKIEAATGYRAAWLVTGKGDKRNHGNVKDVSIRSKVPLISWVQAGAWGEVCDMFQPGEADEWVESYETTTSGNSFALRVTGDSMTNPIMGDITFPEGTILIVDPNRSAHAGDYVIAKDVVTQQATFKKLVNDGGHWFLKPLNPAYPTMPIDDPAIRVIGRVVESQIRRKL